MNMTNIILVILLLTFPPPVSWLLPNLSVVTKKNPEKWQYSMINKKTAEPVFGHLSSEQNLRTKCTQCLKINIQE